MSRRRPAPRGKRADLVNRFNRGPFTTGEIRAIEEDLRAHDLLPASRFAFRVGDLERRIAALRARPDARHPGILDNIAGFEEELAEARVLLLGAQSETGAGGIVWHRARRIVHYELPNKSVGRMPAPAISVRREPGQMVVGYPGRRGRVRARVRDAYQLLVDGEPTRGILHTRRNVCRQAHMAVMFGVGFPASHVAALLLPPGTPGRHRRISGLLRARRRFRRGSRRG